MPTTIEIFQSDLQELFGRHQAFEALFSLPLSIEPDPFCVQFIFPKTSDYCNWIYERERCKDYKGLVGQSDQSLYNQIINREEIPAASKNLRLKVNGVYIIADSIGEVLYIGKSGANFREDCGDWVINRIIDHLLPKSINKMQNTEPLWERIERGKHVKVCYWSGLNRLIPTLLELYLLNKYYVEYKTLPPLNKRMKRSDKL